MPVQSDCNKCLSRALVLMLSAGLLLGGCVSDERAEQEALLKLDSEKPKADAVENAWYDPFGWFSDNDEKKKPVEIPYEAYGKLGYSLAWSGFAAVQPGYQLKDIQIMDGLILANDTRAAFTAMSPISGDVRWARLQGSTLSNFLGAVQNGRQLYLIDDSDVYVVTAESGEPVADSRSNNPIKQHLARVASTKPLPAGNSIILGSGSGHAFAHVPSIGGVKGGGGATSWQYLIGGNMVANPTVLNNGLVVFVTDRGGILVINVESGTASGRASVYGAIVASAAAGPDKFFVVSTDQSIYAFDDTNARPLWRVKTEAKLTEAPTYDAGRVYVQVPGLGLAALDAETGRKIWTCGDTNGRVIAKRKNQLITWDGQTVVTVDPAGGSVVQRVDLPGLMDLRAETFADGNLYCIWKTGQISKLTPR